MTEEDCENMAIQHIEKRTNTSYPGCHNFVDVGEEGSRTVLLHLGLVIVGKRCRTMPVR